MTTLYVGIGHGIEPDGTYDPGAVHGDLVEHHLAGQVAAAMVTALQRSGFHDFAAEHLTDPATDVDYRGSVIRANAMGARYVLEVHFNASGTSGSGHGTMTLCYRDAGVTGAWAHRVQAALDAAVGIRNDGVIERTDLWLLRGSTGSALIPEVAFVDGDATALSERPHLCRNAGEALAAATLAQLGHRYVPPGDPGYSVVNGDGTHPARWANLDEAVADTRHRFAVGRREVIIRH